MVNIKVAVRIRPLSRRESLLGEDVIVRKENKTVLVINPKIPERQDGDSRQRTRRFVVDFCYDPTEPEGCTQEAVYKEIGSEVLDSMFDGYNACVLAYGHSASGKTYTIMGMQNDPGLTPRLCCGLFEKLDERYFNERIRVQVIVSFLEIYNEKVRDLLGSEETVEHISLRVREHPKLGPYVQGLSEHLVADRRKLLELLTAGNRRRSTAATENNIHSSRSHAVFTIQFKQCDGENFETEKSSKVHLVDLAGSLQKVSRQETRIVERASSSQSKERLKEGANINKSLVTLGNVVSALAENCESSTLLKAQSNSKSWHPFVPYRDSVLTWLLKDTLGGNSNTIMIATISSASSCFSETVNTLRYAKRTKRIVNSPIVNEDPKIRTIRQLREEIVRLKRLLFSYQSCGSWSGWSEVEETNLDEAMFSSLSESKWLDPGGTNITNKENKQNEIKKRRSFTQDEEEGTGDCENTNEIKYFKDDEEGKNLGEIGQSSGKDCEEGALVQGVAFSESNACKINDEKKSDVNGSVNDIFSHETQIFSDSLESFSSVFLKSENACETAHDGSGRPGTVKIREPSAEKYNPCLVRDFSSFENLSKKKTPGMLHRSRPDLIKGISSRSKEGLPSGSSQSCTDVSNLSQSTSENSLNSSGSVEISPLKRRQTQDRGENESLPLGLRKTEKRSEIVEAVTSRLYVTKKKSDRRGMAAKEDGKLEELKLCKRTRMKLFDLSRKLAMTRKIRQTVDNDTQTENMTATLRVKEKCVTTEPRELSDTEEMRTPEENYNEEKPCVIMNQVFIPRASNYVVECGKVVRIEAPEAAGKHESATQTGSEAPNSKNANTSPIKLNIRDEDCFSEDSLDLEDKTRVIEEQKVVNSEQKVSFHWPQNSEVYFTCDSEKRFRRKSKPESEKLKETLFNGLPLIIFSEETIPHGEDTGILLSDACENSSEEWRKEENLSSENSFTSVEGTDMSCSSETSSEDFVFYESSKEKDTSPKTKLRGSRELYTITENSEQSDPSDAFSPVQSQMSSLNVEQESEAENQNLQGEKIQKETEMPVDVKGAEIRNEFESKQNKNERRNMDKIFTNFTQTSNCNKIKPENSEVPKSIFLITSGTNFKSPDRVPRFAENSDIKLTHPKRFQCQLRGAKTDFKSWTDIQPNSQKQFLNMNIPSNNNTATASTFSVDTHLFGKTLGNDQNADAMFNSTDSITFVFMGPAKPKTSVLMELIRRSLGKTLSSSDESSSFQRKSRSRGVQCDANLMRSVSVDSAMIALSRIAKNQEPSLDMRRTASLRALSPNETQGVLSQGNNHWDFIADNSEGEKKKSALKYSFVGCTDSVEKIKNKKTEEAEKAKKSVSWSEEAEDEELGWEAPNFDLNYENPPEVDAEDFKEGDSSWVSLEKQSRLLSKETRNHTGVGTSLGQMTEPIDPLKAFLEEATRLLKYINFCSSKYPEFSRETLEGNQTKECYNRSKNPDSVGIRSKSLEKNARWRSRTSGPMEELKAGNSTWPRMRPTMGKPPSGMKPKFSSRPDSLHLNGFSHSRSDLTGSRTQSWNLSNLTVPPKESRNRLPTSRSSCCNESLKGRWVRESYSPLPAASPVSNIPAINFNTLSELETDVEESCRRLEIATERDRMRESVSNIQKGPKWVRKETGVCCRANEFQWGKMEAGVIKRRKPEKCAGICCCTASKTDPCKYLWSKGCRSSFELDSFGPGSSHCQQHCMFCRKKDAELYYSALSLNSKCTSELCRLNYYGYCPCSSVRLSHVTSSPRAYMQRLLALRRRIVSQTERVQLDGKTSNGPANGEAQRRNFLS